MAEGQSMTVADVVAQDDGWSACCSYVKGDALFASLSEAMRWVEAAGERELRGVLLVAAGAVRAAEGLRTRGLALTCSDLVVIGGAWGRRDRPALVCGPAAGGRSASSRLAGG